MNEVDAVTTGLVAPTKEGGLMETASESIPRQVVIGHVDTVNIYLTPAVAGNGVHMQCPADPALNNPSHRCVISRYLRAGRVKPSRPEKQPS